MENKPTKRGWKQMLYHETVELGINFIYLAIFFGVFLTYRRLILAQYSISYMNYGFALLEALIMAKVIMIIDAFHLGRKYENQRLCYSTLYKAVIFTLGAFAFKMLEHVVRGLWTGKGWPGVEAEFVTENMYASIANCMVVFVAFIPFFAFKELGRVLGENKLHQLFFAKRTLSSDEVS